MTRPQSADNGDTALLSAPGAVCVSREDRKEHISEGRMMLRQAFSVIYLAIGRIWCFESLKIVFLVWCKDCRLPSNLYVSNLGSSSQPVGCDLFGRHRITLLEQSSKTSGKHRYLHFDSRR